MSNITQDKLVISGTFTGPSKRIYDIRITPRNNENPGPGPIGYSVFKWRVTNVDRHCFLKFTSSSTTVVVQKYNSETDTYSDHDIGLPIYVGDKIKESSGGGNFDAADEATVSSISSGTEGVNVKSFVINAVPDAVSNVATGVLAAETEGASGSSVTLTVDTVAATEALFLNKKVYKYDGALYGTCTAVNSTTEIVFGAGLSSQITNNENLFVPTTLNARCFYEAQFRTHNTESVPRLCSEHNSSVSTVTSPALHGLTFYFNHANMASDVFAEVGGGGGLINSYYYYRFTGYPQKTFTANSMTRTVKDGKQGILGWNSSEESLYYVSDIYADGINVENVSGVSVPLSYNRKLPNKPTMVTKGDDTYLGVGKLKPPVFVGYPNFKQFGKKMGDEIVVEDGNIIVNQSVLPQFEQFVFPKSDGSTTFAHIDSANWNLNLAASIIVGYEKDGGYLIKATRDGGIESTLYIGGVISAIRLDPVETNMLWVLSNVITHYKIMKIDINAAGTAMELDSNRVYSITRTTGETGNLIPAASSTSSRLTDLIVIDNRIYVQASAYNVETIAVEEALFNGIDPDRKAYIWKSDSISGSISNIPTGGSTPLVFTDITPSFSPDVNDPTANDYYEPYWFKFTEISETEATGGTSYVGFNGFVSGDELGGEQYQLKYKLPLRGLCIWNAKTNEESIGLMIPYSANSKNSSSSFGWAKMIDTIDHGTTNGLSVVEHEYLIGPFVRRASKHHILGSHIQLFHDVEAASSARLSARSSDSATTYKGIRRLPCSLSTKPITDSFGIDWGGEMVVENFVGYGDGAEFTDYSSITTSIVDVTSPSPKTVTIGHGKELTTWDLWQGDGSAANPLHYIATTDLSADLSTFLPNVANNTNEAILNLSESSPIKREFSPSNDATDEDTESEMSSPIRLAAQTISFDTNGTPDQTNTTAVNFPDSDFGIYFDNEIEKNASQTAWTKLSIDSAIEISVATSSSSEYNLTNLRVDATFDDPAVTSGSDVTTAYEDSDFYHNFYRVSIMYDGYQESCLSNTKYVSATNPDKTGHKVTIKVRTDTLSKRLSHINIYRAKGTQDNYPDTDYRLVKSISLDGDGWMSPASGNGNILEYFFDDIVGANFGTYESLTGMSPAMNINYLSYSISEECAGYLFVTNAQNPEISGVGNYIFRSKPGKYNVFNWANEYTALPENIVGLQSYNNLLYAFSSSAVYTINPNNLSIIDSMQGQGVLSDDSIIATDYGMFFADKYGLYVHNGKSSVKISQSIQESDNTSLSSLDWNSIDWEANPAVLGFDSQRKSVLCFFVSSSNSYAWVYSPMQKRWDLWSFTNKINAITIGKYGEILASDGQLIRIGTSSTRKAWEFQSKKVTAGFDTYEKQFKEVRAEGTSGLAVKYKSTKSIVDSSSFQSLTSTTRLSSAYSKSKWLQIQVVDSVGTRQLESLGIHLRPLKARSTKV
tara:strand:+ start:3118 stop:7470 length:4353 start_codon:yes stop_codon:yes gene_type:complete